MIDNQINHWDFNKKRDSTPESKILNFFTLEAGLDRSYEAGEISKNQWKKGKAFYYNKRREMSGTVEFQKVPVRELPSDFVEFINELQDRIQDKEMSLSEAITEYVKRSVEDIGKAYKREINGTIGVKDKS